MTLNEFVKKYNGKKVDYDGVYGAQCVDLYRQYLKEVLALPQTPAVTGAKDIWKECGSFKKAPHSPGRTYTPGDVLVYSNGTYGHVCVFLAPLGDGLLVFEQDGFKQDGAKISLLSQEGLLGALYA